MMKLKTAAVAGLLMVFTVVNQAQAHVYWWGWGGWGHGAVTAFGDEVRAIGMARLAYAEANYRDALAAKEWAKAAAYARLGHALALDLRRLNRNKAQLDRARVMLDNRVRSLNALNMGKVTPAALASLTYFSTLPGFPSLEVSKTSVGPFAAEQFTAAKGAPTEAFAGGSAAQFIGWMRAKRYTVVVSTDPKSPTAWQTLMTIAEQIRQQVALTDEAIQQKQVRDTAAVLETWGANLWLGNGVLRDFRHEIKKIEGGKP